VPGRIASADFHVPQLAFLKNICLALRPFELLRFPSQPARWAAAAPPRINAGAMIA
jgi:hypothetical protein